MKIVFVLFSVFIFSCLLFAQPVFKKQISFLDFDARNPSFIETNAYEFSFSLFPQRNALLFEGYKDPAKPQIFILKYDNEKDTFFIPTQITFSKGSCINPCGVFVPIGNVAESNTIIWQTNENGTWDIACGELYGDTLKNIRYLANDTLDEINPRIVNPADGYFNGITYEKGGSVYLYFEIDTLKITEKIFAGSDSFRYGNACAKLAYSSQNKRCLGTIAAEKIHPNGDKRIVFVTKDYFSQNWTEEAYLFDSTTITTSPKFISGLHIGNYLTFETQEFGIRRLRILWEGDFGDSKSASMISDSSYENFNFSMKSVPQVTKSFRKSSFGYGHSIYQIRKENKNFLLPNYFNNNGRFRDSLIAIRLDEPKITTEYVKYNNGWYFVYSVWEDSSDNGTVQLFGSSGLYTIGGIDDETSPQDFTLYQNYPNPFNPETVISYKLLSRSFVTLKVFDVLGRLVLTLVNEEKPAGEYQVLFSNQLTTNSAFGGHQLSSGVLFYQLKVGDRLQTRKMLLMK
ncbi:MAG: T9SS type A sorting domain-containing protein [Ignavibacteriaceae bacterium]|nr:T9SS type A sorting domain-containing protein [Ignavibacteriaceae bacterium]